MPAPYERLRFQYQGDVHIESGVLHYGDGKQITPFSQVDDPAVMVGIIANGRLSERRLLIGHQDEAPAAFKTPTGEEVTFDLPGKSAFLYFKKQPTKDTIGELTDIALQRELTRDDHVHLTTVEWAGEVGWRVFWVPLPRRNNWLHVRLVPDVLIERGTKPTEVEAAALAGAFVKAI